MFWQRLRSHGEIGICHRARRAGGKGHLEMRCHDRRIRPQSQEATPNPNHPTQEPSHRLRMHACMLVSVCICMHACMHVRMYTCDSLIHGAEIGNDVLQFGQHCLNAHAHSLLPFGSLAHRSAQHIPVAARPVCVCVCVRWSVYTYAILHTCVCICICTPPPAPTTPT